jgi:hypothetical protein
MSSFINFNNRESGLESKYSAEVIKTALLKSETKSSIKAETLTKNIKEPVSLNEALVFFTDKLGAIKQLSQSIVEINEGRVKQFEMDYASMVKDIKKGYGWIDPDYVADTWDNSSDSIDFELVRDEIFDRLIAAGLLAHADDNDPEKAGKKIKSAKDLYVMESEEEVEEISETRYYAFHKGQKHEIEADSLWGAKQKAITDLKVKKKDVGMLAIVLADSHDDFSKGKNSEFAFEGETTVYQSATAQLADEEKFELYTATLKNKTATLKATTTTKTWDDGVPVLKYLARGKGKPTEVNINGSFEVAHDHARGWFYFTDGRKWFGLHIEDGYGDSTDLPFNMEVKESEVNEASRKSIKKYKGLTYLTYFEAPKGYSVNGIGELSGVVGSPEFFETEKEAQEYAEEQIKYYLGEATVTEAYGKSAGLTKEETMEVAQKFATNEAFYRMSSDTVGTELYAASQALTTYYDWLQAGNDSGEGKSLDHIIDLLKKCKNSIKKFNKAAEVKGTAYESLVNEAKGSALQDYVETVSQKTFKGGGNGQNLLDEAMGLAGHIDSYALGRDTRGYEEDGFYGPLTITAFKKLVDQMSADDIKNNQADKYESVVTEAMFSVNDLKKPGLIWWYNKKGDKAQVTKIDKIDNLNFPRANDAPKDFDISWGMGTLDEWIEKTGEKNPKVGEVYDIDESVVTEGVMSEIDIIAKEAKNFKEFVKAFKTDGRYKGLDDAGDTEEFEAWLQSVYDNAKMNESVVNEAKFDKKSLMKAMKKDDGFIQLGNGQEYIIYAYDNGNDDNDAMWGDKTIFALDQDGEEHEVKYSDIVSYNESVVTESKEADEAESILNDLLDERDMDELHGMSMEDALDTVGAYGHKGSKAKKIAQELVSMTNESAITEGRSINKIQKEWTQVTTDMIQKVQAWKDAEGDRKAEILEELKALTARKKALESELDVAVAGKDKDVQLVVSEGNAFGAARAKAIANGEKTFKVEGEEYDVEGVDKEDKENAEEFVSERNAFLAARAKAIQEESDEFEFNGKTYPVIYEGNAFGAARAEAIANGASTFTVDGEEYDVEDVDAEDKKNAEEFVEESEILWDALIEKFAITNEDLRSDIKKYIKTNKKEIDALADQDDWDRIYSMLMTDFEVEEDDDKAADELKTIFNIVY